LEQPTVNTKGFSMKGMRYFSTGKYGASGGDGDHDDNHYNYNNFPFTLAGKSISA